MASFTFHGWRVPTEDTLLILGRGSAATVTRFATEEGRDYYIQARTYQDALNLAADERDHLKSSIKGLVTPSGRVRRKALLALIEQISRETA